MLYVLYVFLHCFICTALLLPKLSPTTFTLLNYGSISCWRRPKIAAKPHDFRQRVDLHFSCLHRAKYCRREWSRWFADIKGKWLSRCTTVPLYIQLGLHLFEFVVNVLFQLLSSHPIHSGRLQASFSRY